MPGTLDLSERKPFINATIESGDCEYESNRHYSAERIELERSPMFLSCNLNEPQGADPVDKWV